MAWQQGTATNYLDLMTRLADFASGVTAPDGASPALPVGERWTILRNAGGELIMQGPGLAATDQIFVGAKGFTNAGADYFNWFLSGFTGYESAAAFEAQPGAHHVGTGADQSGPILHLWNASIPYWFIVNGRRILIVAKISTVYVSAVLGLLENPYASPGQWPYPLVIGGSGAWQGALTLTSTNLRWSYTGTENSNWFYPATATSAGSCRHCQLRVRLASGTWWGFNSDYDHAGFYSTYVGRVYPLANGGEDLRPNLDGTYPRIPLILDMKGAGGASDVNAFGEFGSAAWVTGHGNAAENTLTDGADTWLVVQNIFRTTKKDYCAFKLA